MKAVPTRGAALVEFAVTIALLLGLVMGLVDLSRGLGLRHRAAALSREGANLASRSMDIQEAVDFVTEAALPLDLRTRGAVIVSQLEKEGSGFRIAQQRSSAGAGRASRLGVAGDPVPIPDADIYVEGSILFASEVLIDFEPITPFEKLQGIVLPDEVYESTVFYGSTGSARMGKPGTGDPEPPRPPRPRKPKPPPGPRPT